MRKSIGGYIVNAGLFFMGVTQETILRHEEESVQKERENGISITTAALYEAKVKDEEIIRIIQKYYGIAESEAQECLRIEKRVDHPCRELQSYLMREEAFSAEEARNYIIEKGTVELLKKEQALWKLSPKELLKKIEE